MSEETPTAPENEAPSDPHPAWAAAEHFAELVGVMLEPVTKGLAEHQAAEIEHHRRVEIQLKTILEQEQSFGRRLTELERRVSHLATADTEPPEPA